MKQYVVRMWRILPLVLASSLALVGRVAGQPSTSPTSAPALASGVSEDLLARVDQLEDAGDHQGVVRLLETNEATSASGRLLVQLGMAYLAVGRAHDAERALASALESLGDPWVTLRRDGIEYARATAHARLATLVVRCSAPGVRLRVGGREIPVEAGVATIVEDAGTVELRVSAPGRRAQTRVVPMVRSTTQTVSFDLAEAACTVEGMIPIDDLGTCCWPGQQSVDDLCSGTPTCPSGMMASGGTCIRPDAEAPGGPPVERQSPNGVLFGWSLGYGQMLGNDASLFRPDASDPGRTMTHQITAELRIGGRFARFISLQVGGGAGFTDMESWNDSYYTAPSTSPGYGDAHAIAYWAGVYTHLHTSRTQRPGAVDFFLGGGFEPMNVSMIRRHFMGSDAWGVGTLQSYAVPLEVGLSFFASRSVALDVIGQTRLYMPRSYSFSDGSGGAVLPSYTLRHGSGELSTLEIGWSARIGLSFLF